MYQLAWRGAIDDGSRVYMHSVQSCAAAVVVHQPKSIYRLHHRIISIYPCEWVWCANAWNSMACICDLRAVPNILTDHFTHHSLAHRFRTSSSVPLNFLLSMFFAAALQFYLACFAASFCYLLLPVLYFSLRFSLFVSLSRALSLSPSQSSGRPTDPNLFRMHRPSQRAYTHENVRNENVWKLFVSRPEIAKYHGRPST